jgi:hypothetical protein
MSCMWCVRMHDFFSSARRSLSSECISRHVSPLHISECYLDGTHNTHARHAISNQQATKWGRDSIGIFFFQMRALTAAVSVPDCKISNYQESDQCPGDWKLPSERARTNRLCADRYAEITCTHRQKIMAPAAIAIARSCVSAFRSIAF